MQRNIVHRCMDDVGNFMLSLPQCVISPKPGTLLNLTQPTKLEFVYDKSAECNPYGDTSPSLGLFEEFEGRGIMATGLNAYAMRNNSLYHNITIDIDQPVDNRLAVGLLLTQRSKPDTGNPWVCIAPLEYTYVKSNSATSNASVARISYALLVFCAMALF
ncbi:hypothetical protein K7432_007864 [Basidiobolus ranarum]|uniref:Uncharacterized protein n=1 Tax=Basidiobolus ranarum TaxID=34480 RepID=A0ABR2WSN7_9FUNG